VLASFRFTSLRVATNRSAPLLKFAPICPLQVGSLQVNSLKLATQVTLQRVTWCGILEYAFGDLFEAVRPNEQAEHIVVITVVAEFSQVHSSDRHRVRISSLSPPDCTLIVKPDLFKGIDTLSEQPVPSVQVCCDCRFIVIPRSQRLTD